MLLPEFDIEYCVYERVDSAGKPIELKLLPELDTRMKENSYFFEEKKDKICDNYRSKQS